MSRTAAYLTLMSCGAAAALPGYVLAFAGRQRRLAANTLISSRLREGFLLLFWMFCGGMAAVTLTPRWVAELVRSGDWAEGHAPFFQWGSVSLVPLETFAADAHSIYILLGNIILFLPFGFLAALLWRGYHGKRSLLLGIGISGGIECWQLTVGRTFDVDDLLLNTLGVLTGFLLWKLSDKVLPKGLRQLHCTEREIV